MVGGGSWPHDHVVVHRPGQVVALDTTVLPVKVREHVFGDPVSVHLTLALDVYTRSIVAFRLTLVSDTSVDVAMVLRDVMLPLPLRDDWGEDMEWPYPGVPAAVVAEFAGHRVAALPFFAPETVTTDHGAVYKNHHLVEVQRVLGCNILPARVLRPTDKQAVERTFAAIQSLLFEHLLGYQGVDVADRGVDPEADAALTIVETEHLLATWVVRVWQNRRLGEHAPSWDPGGQHSPNSLFAAAMGQLATAPGRSSATRPAAASDASVVPPRSSGPARSTTAAGADQHLLRPQKVGGHEKQFMAVDNPDRHRARAHSVAGSCWSCQGRLGICQAPAVAASTRCRAAPGWASGSAVPARTCPMIRWTAGLRVRPPCAAGTTIVGLLLTARSRGRWQPTGGRARGPAAEGR